VCSSSLFAVIVRGTNRVRRPKKQKKCNTRVCIYTHLQYFGSVIVNVCAFVCVCVCVRVSVSVFAQIYTLRLTHAYTCTHLYRCKHVHTKFRCMHTYVQICRYIYTISLYMHMYIHIHIYVYMYEYIHSCTHTHTCTHILTHTHHTHKHTQKPHTRKLSLTYTDTHIGDESTDTN